MFKTKQIVVISSVVILMILLYSMDIKGLVKPKDGGIASDGQHASEQAQAAVAQLTVEAVSESAKENLSADLVGQITTLEGDFRQASGAKKLDLAKQLARQWDDVAKAAPKAFYQEIVAEQENSAGNWIKAGDSFTDAYQNTEDSIQQPALVQKAIGAYKKAVALDPNSLDAKTGLGVAYVSGTGSPMEGIQLLLGVVKEDPDNIKANKNLGLFSMKSGQYEKAVKRFKTILAVKPDSESWFYLASSYENLGQKDEAIAAYTKCKELGANPGLSKFVDEKVQELKK